MKKGQKFPSGRLYDGRGWIELNLDEPDLQRARALLNTYSGPWAMRDRELLQQDTEDSLGREVETMTRLARGDSPDVIEMFMLLRHWFWPMHNEIVRLRKQLADVKAAYAELDAYMKGELT